MNTKLGKLYGIGLGPGDPELITLKALKVLQNIDVIFTAVSKQSNNSVSSRIVKQLPDIKADTVELVFAMRNTASRAEMIKDNAMKILSYIKEGKNCAFTTIGDPLTYSTFGYLLKEIQNSDEDVDVTVIPGVNAWSALAAKTATVLVEDLETLTIIPSYNKEQLSISLGKTDIPQTKVYLKTYRSKDSLLEQLQTENKSILYGSNMGLDNEFVSTNIKEIKERDYEYLSMMIEKDPK